jgi:hypothetical protein
MFAIEATVRFQVAVVFWSERIAALLENVDQD